LRRRAEEIAREEIAQMPENLDTLTPEETSHLLHELRVYQIELEIQNEELRRAQVELDAARSRYFDLYDLAPVGYCTISEPGLILEANLTAVTLLGVARSNLVNQPLFRFILKEDQDIYYLHRKQLFETGEPQACELRMVKSDGTPFWSRQETTVAQDADGAPVCRIVLSDTTDRKKMEDDILVLSITDQLTSLHNRRGFLSLAGQQLKLSDRNKKGLELFFADLDLLKQINDTLGHEEGDKALIEAANIFRETFRTSDIIARLGGDEFAVIAIDTDDVSSGIFNARLQQLIDIRNNKENRKYKLSISVGCSYYDPENPCSIDELIARADKLMYGQKQKKKLTQA